MFWTSKVVGVTSNLQHLRNFMPPRATSVDGRCFPNTSRDEQSFINNFIASFDVLDMQSCWCNLEPPTLAQLHAAARNIHRWSMLPPTHPGMNNPSPTTSLHPSMLWTSKVVGVTSNLQDLRNFMRRAQHPSMVDASPTHPGMNNPPPTTSLHPSMFWTSKVVGVTSNLQDLRNFMPPRNAFFRGVIVRDM